MYCSSLLPQPACQATGLWLGAGMGWPGWVENVISRLRISRRDWARAWLDFKAIGVGIPPPVPQRVCGADKGLVQRYYCTRQYVNIQI